MRTKKYFRAHENIFLCARKFIFFRKEINFLAEGNFTPCPQQAFTEGKAGEKNAFAGRRTCPAKKKK